MRDQSDLLAFSGRSQGETNHLERFRAEKARAWANKKKNARDALGEKRCARGAFSASKNATQQKNNNARVVRGAKTYMLGAFSGKENAHSGRSQRRKCYSE